MLTNLILLLFPLPSCTQHLLFLVLWARYVSEALKRSSTLVLRHDGRWRFAGVAGSYLTEPPRFGPYCASARYGIHYVCADQTVSSDC